MSALRLIPLVYWPWLFALLCQGCVYDHRVTQAILERRRRAKAAEGARISGGGSAALPVRHVGRVLLYVSQDYRQQHPLYRDSLRDLVDAANGVIGPAFQTRLDVVGVHDWNPTCDPAQLEQCLAELSTLETTEAESWVVGMLGALPRYTTSFHELGYAQVPGRHMVLRDVSDIEERRAIDAAFATHTPSARDEIYSKRKAHKRLAVFLHEWGHTLGALHTLESGDLLNAAYDDRMAHFGAANQAVIAAGLHDRFSGRTDHANLLAAVESASAGSFSTRDRELLLVRLRAGAPPQAAGLNQAAGVSAPRAAGAETSSGPTAPQAKHPFVIQGDPATLLASVSEVDRSVYMRAVEQLVSGNDAAAALQTLMPLLTNYPDCYAVQHLGCGLLMQGGSRSRSDAQTVCTRAQALATAAH